MAEPATLLLMAAKSKWLRKLVCGILVLLFGVLLLFLLMIGSVFGVLDQQGSDPSLGTSLSEQVLSYRETVEEYAAQYGVEDYVPLILCVMQVESGGLGTDVMQSSLFSCNTKYPKELNGILDSRYSIECGIRVLADCLKAAECASPDDLGRVGLAVQGYAFGFNYIYWASDRYGSYTVANAEEYASMVEEATGEYYGGDPYYAQTVLQFYTDAHSTGFGYPMPDHTAVSSAFGYRPENPVTGEKGEFHKGVDFPAPEGTEIFASADGKVTVSTYSASYGFHVMIQHADGVVTHYAHCSALLAKVGDRVMKGDVIALCGSTGQSTGSHCHFEMTVNGEYIDPIGMIETEG